ncbi:Tyrosine recombinase XerD [Sulfitobacter sp. DSM 110093]|uniref:tyrosine-type recombinase/integrase n=1 Tax=Sulfitobacter sp. DSM 110093 TaxID=2883127 RepID=UPI001FAD1605|nr:tyrosine-type recombinase/integrase [Sulfitobacter sp. DSM 110093]UOA31937.1 Tyrosine recombinase XerD [Sulfitobacter sp. DSM 110093]
MQYLTKPRGRGYSLRMVTPDILIGTVNPWTSKPFGREIKLGLNTRSHAEAVRLRDVRIGQIRQLEADALESSGRRHVGNIIALTPENAAEWRKMREEANDPEALDLVLSDELERAERVGKGQQAEAFGKMVFRGAIPLAKALEMYLEEREEGNPYGYDPLAITSAMNVRSSMRHLITFLDEENPTLHDVTPHTVFRFRNEYLPLIAKVSPKTVAKHTTLLRGLWAWAITDKRLLKTRSGKAIANPWVVKEQGTSKRKATKKKPDEKRNAFTSPQVTKLFEGFPEWGNREGDLLRLALATGCRVDEIGALKLEHVLSDGSGFDVVKGKTANSTRFIPVVDKAQRLLAQRVEMVRNMQENHQEDELRLFPEWPLKPSTQKVNSASQWFTRYRRQTLGVETDGKLAMHSFRHTWRTIARRAGVAEDRIHELGGWSDEQKNTSKDYDHGLGDDLLREEQLKVWQALKSAGYLEVF